MGISTNNNKELGSTMDQSRFIPFPQRHVQNSKALWDFGSYPERKDNDGLLFEKEVLDIQAKEEESTPFEESESDFGACVTCICFLGFVSCMWL